MTNQLNYFAHAALDTLYTRSHLTRPSRLVLSPKVTPTPDYYTVLGLSRDASEQEINRAWRKAVLLHHPDKRQALSHDQHDIATESARTGVDIRLINEAKWILSDTHRRKDWEDSFHSSDGHAPVKVDTTPHVSYDISLSAFTPHFSNTSAGQVSSEDHPSSNSDDDEEEPLYYSHPCRCSSEFIITYQDLLDGVDVVGCGGCGEWVRVGYEAVSDDE